MAFFDMLQNFAHRREMAESLDEILVGQVIAVMADRGYPLIGVTSDSDWQSVRFRTLGDEVLYSVTVTLNRLTGGLTAKLVGSVATLSITAEVKNFLTDPDDLLEMFRTDISNLMKIPLLSGGVKLNHQLNSVLATSQKLVKLEKLTSPESLKELDATLRDEVDVLREHLKPYKKSNQLAG
ncbi:MAG: hypothetical protein AB1758_05195 [Candidatus Eremiobacterota bacterium]